MKGIVFENREFKVVSYEEEDNEIALAFKPSEQYPQRSFSMLNGIDACIHKPWGNGSPGPLTIDFNFKKIKIGSRLFGSFSSAVNLLNEYNQLSSEEIQSKYEAALKNERTELEKEIEHLKEQKINLKKFISEKIMDMNSLLNEITRQIDRLKK